MDKLNRLDAILNELQMDEYLNEDSLPKINEARGLVNELVKNCSIPDVVNRREELLDFADYSESDKTSKTTDECVDNYLDLNN